jgi:hypothetical protein
MGKEKAVVTHSEKEKKKKKADARKHNKVRQGKADKETEARRNWLQEN